MMLNNEQKLEFRRICNHQLLGTFDRGMQLGSPILDPISDRKLSLSSLVTKSRLQDPWLF